MRLSTVLHAGEDEVFAPNAFDSQLGKAVMVNVGSTPVRGVLVEVSVARPVGRYVELTIELDERVPVDEIPGSLGPMSFGPVHRDVHR